MATDLPPTPDLSGPSAPVESVPESVSVMDRLWRWKGLLLIALTLAVTAVGLTVRAARQKDDTPPAERFQQALSLLPEAKSRETRGRIRRLIEDLDEQTVLDAGFSGGLEYIRGIVAYRAAREAEREFEDRTGYGSAARSLVEAERRGLPDEYRASWAKALGLSLVRERVSVALPYLKEAWTLNEEEDITVGLAVGDTVLRTSERKDFAWALEVTTALLALDDLTPEQRGTCLRQRCDLALGQENLELAEAAFDQLTDSGGDDDSLRSARFQMARGDYDQAIEMLEPLTRRTGLDRTLPSIASLLMGECARARSDRKQALDWWSETIKKYPDSEEAVTAMIWSARELRASGRTEESLTFYEQALRRVAESSGGHGNRWLSETELRTECLAAWSEWMDAGDFRTALALTDAMQTLLSEPVWLKTRAQTQTRWATSLEQSLASASEDKRSDQMRAMFDRWEQSGSAWEELANVLTRSEDLTPALWTGANHFRNAHAYSDALRLLDRFFEGHSGQFVPPGLLMRGQILMSLDQLEKAEANFRDVVESHPDSPVVYESAFWLGQCLLEQGEDRHAEAVWRDLLQSPDLSPSAKEWRRAMFSLAETLFIRASYQRILRNLQEDQTPEERKKSREKTDRQLMEAADLFTHFLRRYPDVEVSHRARYYLGKTFQETARIHRRFAAEAETDNARQDRLRKQDADLEDALVQFRQLRDDLEPRERQGTLPELDQALLRQARGEIGHTLLGLKNYPAAISAYISFVNHHPDDPQIVLAYMQMANAYAEMGKTEDAANVREQARLLLTQLPDTAFEQTNTSLQRTEWQTWLDRSLTRSSNPETGETP